MAYSKLNISEFTTKSNHPVILDVRSPSEFAHAHIPGAISFPLFSDEERKIVGTIYKQESREKAIKAGLDYFGRNMVKLVETAEKILAERNTASREFFVHCWRGGMRSASVAWLLDLYGFKISVLTGGYKAYRNYVLSQFEKSYNFNVIGGYTGSDKTGILQQLKSRGEKIIDLEDLAGHKGSVFGNLRGVKQPSQEMFENLLATALVETGSENFFWLEDENQRVGDVNIPVQFYKMMRHQRMFFLEVPFELRLEHLVNNYGKFEKEKFINGIMRIKKRLGGLETKTAINFILEDDLKNCFAILLKYYDKYYLKSSLNREDAQHIITSVHTDSIDTHKNISILKLHAGIGK